MKNSWIKKSLILGAVLSVAISGCRKEATFERCSDRGAGSDYQKGVDIAKAENQAEYERGKSLGLALSYEDGLAAGKGIAYNSGYNGSSGYSKGYNDGYKPGYDAGFASTNAFTQGQNAGAAEGRVRGQADGTLDGKDDGYYDGFLQGYADGYDDGYDDGYYAGGVAAYNDPRSCTPGQSAKSQAAKTSSGRDWPTECQKSGYDSTVDLQNSYNKGYTDGALLNTKYQSGLTAGKNDAATFNLGVSDGYNAGKKKGYDDGFAKGYQERYNQGYKSAYTLAYNSSYAIAYNSAYKAWWYEGYDDGYYDTGEGYDDGYDVGYVDGFEDQCSRMSSASEAVEAVGPRLKVTGGNYRRSTRFNQAMNLEVELLHSRTNPSRKLRSAVIHAQFAKSPSYIKSPVLAIRGGGLDRSSVEFKTAQSVIRAGGGVGSVRSIRQNMGKEALNRNVNKRFYNHKAVQEKLILRTHQVYRPLHP